jgi:hypothetical protein
MAGKRSMMSVEKSTMLQSLLGGLPPKAAMRLARAIEVDRLAGGTILPHDMILNALRPTLRSPVRVERTPTPLRVFCLPTPRREKNRRAASRAPILRSCGTGSARL